MKMQKLISFYDVERRKRNERSGFSGGINKSKELPFIILCIEEYKGMAGKEVIDLFNKYSYVNIFKLFTKRCTLQELSISLKI